MLGYAGLTPMELLIILVLAVLLFGHKLRDVGHRLGKAIIDFRRFWGRPDPPRRKPRDPDDQPPDSAPSPVPRRPKPPTDFGSIAKETPPPEQA